MTLISVYVKTLHVLTISLILSQFSALQFSSRTGIRRTSSFVLFYIWNIIIVTLGYLRHQSGQI